MKVVLSKKGFDGEYGGVASPLLDGTSIISLPIPAVYREDKRIRYADIQYGSHGKITDLLKKMGIVDIKVTKSKKKSEWRNVRELPAHLDPDIHKESYPRKRGWRGLFGINGTSQTHIENETGGKGLEPGDLFLFYGWFEKHEHNRDRLVNIENRKDYPTGRNVIFGYLQIDKILPLYEMKKEDSRIESWMEYHPHIGENRRIVGDSVNFRKNTLYVARQTFEKTEKPGFGLFHYDRDSAGDITLTKKACTKSQWSLPQAFSSPNTAWISRNPNGWKTWNGGKGYFQSIRGYGQE